MSAVPSMPNWLPAISTPSRVNAPPDWRMVRSDRVSDTRTSVTTTVLSTRSNAAPSVPLPFPVTVKPESVRVASRTWKPGSTPP